MTELLQQSFFHNALVSGTLVGAMCSFVGVYVLLKRVVFLGIALAQIASAGVALALLLGWSPLLTALAASLGAAAAFSQIRWRSQIPTEAILGASYVLAAALGTVFIAKNPVGEARALTVLFGNILSVPPAELVALAGVAAVVVLLHLLFRKEFVLVSYDYDTAAAQGVSARFWNLLLYLTLGVAIAFAIRSAGVLMTFALLVLPPTGARLLTASVGPLFAVAVGLGTLSVPIGLGAAFVLDLPTGAAIALAAAGLFTLMLVLRAAAGRTRRAVVAAGVTGLLLILAPAPAAAQPATSDIESELRSLREAVSELHRLVTEQQRVINGLKGDTAPPPAASRASDAPATPSSQAAPLTAPPAFQSTAAAAAETPSTTESRGLPPWLALLPEIRVEGNFIGNATFKNRRKLERQLGEGADDDFFVRRDRLSVREVELGLRSAIDPFARFEAIISAEQTFSGGIEVGLEEAILTFGALPWKLQAKVGKFRTGFGEFNEGDPEELPEVDPPNVISNVFGREGDGWIDTGIAISRLFGITDRFSIMLTGGVFNGDNEAAFHGGEGGVLHRPAWYGRAEGFWELSDALGLEMGVGFAGGHAWNEDHRRWLRSRILNAHLELDYKDPVLGLYRGFNFLAEIYYTWRDRLRERQYGDEEVVVGRETLGRFGVYALAELQPTRNWSIGGRFDYSQLPTREKDGPSVRHETAGSLIVSYRPSRFLTLRAQYKHTERNFASHSDEVFLQALFTLGYERPGAF